MWPFSSKTSLFESGVYRGFTDCHCHLLPGVDDGVQKMGDTLKILSAYEQAGFEEVWFTPHIMEDIPNTTDSLRQRFRELQSAYKGVLRLHLAAEYMLDNLFEERLEADDVLPLGTDGRHLLVETSYFNPPVRLQGVLSRIRQKGYHPVLAHPERYNYMTDKYYDQLKEMGVFFQMNLISLAGAYGEVPQKKALKLLKAGYIDYLGTDTHRHRVFNFASSEKALKSSVAGLLRQVPNRL